MNIPPLPGPIAAFDAVAAPILIRDPDGRLIYGNKALRDRLELDLEDFERLQLSDRLIFEGDQDGDEMILSVQTLNGPVKFPARRYAVPFPDGRRGVMSIALPIAESDVGGEGRRLFEMEERFKSFFFAVDYPLAIVSVSDGRILELNPAFDRFYNYGRSVLLSMRLSDFSIGHTAASSSDLHRLLSGEIRIAAFHHRLGDGTLRNVEIHASPVVYEDVDAKAVMVNDITYTPKAETELQSALRRAESASRARSEFLSNASHEFRTPVSGIIGIATLLHDSGLNEDQTHLLSLLEAAAGDLERMLHDLLDISRIDVGKVGIDRTHFSVPSLLERVTGLHAVDTASKALEFSWNHDGTEEFFGDETRLAQVLNNLVGNAVKFTDTGGIEIRSRCDSALILEVADSGRGIPGEKKSEIFEMFRQVENPCTKDRSGLGLGLTIVRSLVDLMGGDVSVRDNPCGGSIFRVVVPRPPEPRGKSGGKNVPCILIVEDDSLSRYYLSTILRKRGFEVVEAEHGESAIELYKPGAYIAVLMDVGLPGKSGIEATRVLRRMEGDGPNTPIWAVTAHGFQSDMDRCFEAGMDGFFLKPADEPKLTARLMELADARGRDCGCRRCSS